jgi:hypothetical protein
MRNQSGAVGDHRGEAALGEHLGDEGGLDEEDLRDREVSCTIDSTCTIEGGRMSRQDCGSTTRRSPPRR